MTGFLAQEEDLAVFTAKMVRLVTDHELRKRMGQNASQVVEKYAVENTTKLMVERYEAVISKAEKRKDGVRLRLTRFLDNWRN